MLCFDSVVSYVSVLSVLGALCVCVSCLLCGVRRLEDSVQNFPSAPICKNFSLFICIPAGIMIWYPQIKLTF